MGNKTGKLNKSNKILYIFLKDFLMVQILKEITNNSAEMNRIYTFEIPSVVSTLINDTECEIKYYDNISKCEITCVVPKNILQSQLNYSYNKIYNEEYIDYRLLNHKNADTDIAIRFNKSNNKPLYIIVNKN